MAEYTHNDEIDYQLKRREKEAQLAWLEAELDTTMSTTGDPDKVRKLSRLKTMIQYAADDLKSINLDHRIASRGEVVHDPLHWRGEGKNRNRMLGLEIHEHTMEFIVSRIEDVLDKCDPASVMDLAHLEKFKHEEAKKIRDLEFQLWRGAGKRPRL